MSNDSSKAFLLSATLHGCVLLLMLLFAYALTMSDSGKKPDKILEMVAGEGDNFGATEAPLLGVPGGIKVEVPPAPKPTPPTPVIEPTPAAPEDVKPEPAPIPPPKPTPAPVPKKDPVPEPAPKKPDAKATKPPEPTTPNFAKKITNQIIRAESQAKRDIAKQRAKDAAIAAARAKEAALAAKYQPVDTTGIAKGVIGGSAKNTTGGAGGKALVRDDGPVMDAYFSMLKERLRSALERPPGLSDTLVAIAEVRISADGSLSGAHIAKSSGSAEFDRAVLDAIGHTRMPARPDGKSDVVKLNFRMKEEDEG